MGSSGRAPAGDYYPTPQAITEQNLKTTSGSRKKKNRPSSLADGQQLSGYAGETPG